mmetsp:Transcript_10527/g.64596  ORF Transcript_10527/g.64596 Transcript_10527/m.64596 type:complete len:229 (+) Transcript_10527:2781-3467(+)
MPTAAEAPLASPTFAMRHRHVLLPPVDPSFAIAIVAAHLHVVCFATWLRTVHLAMPMARGVVVPWTTVDKPSNAPGRVLHSCRSQPSLDGGGTRRSRGKDAMKHERKVRRGVKRWTQAWVQTMESVEGRRSIVRFASADGEDARALWDGDPTLAIPHEVCRKRTNHVPKAKRNIVHRLDRPRPHPRGKRNAQETRGCRRARLARKPMQPKKDGTHPNQRPCSIRDGTG